MRIEFVVCAGCAGGDALAGAIAAACPEVAVLRAPCLSVCAAPVTLAAHAPGRATYVFSGLTAEHATDVAAFARTYLDAPDGWIEDARPLGSLRFRLVTRVPAITMPDAPEPGA